MSLDLINHKLTTSTTNKNGVITWSNPAVNVQINSKGQVFKYGELYEGFSKVDERVIKYSLTTLSEGRPFYAHTSFNSIFSRMVLGVKLGAKTLRLKDTKLGYTKDNVSFVSCSQGAKRGTPVKQQTMNKAQEKVTRVKTPTQEDVATPMDLPKPCKGIGQNQFYTLYEAKNEHTTEDGAVFPTKELAEWHQEKVSKGKGNAQVVLDYNGGYVLAEQIYFQEVVYNRTKPYTNFIDVLNNNQGIVSVVQEEHCKFDKLDNEHGFRSEICFMTLRKQLPEQVSKHQAQKIQGALERYSDSVKALDESIVGLEALLKQVK